MYLLTQDFGEQVSLYQRESIMVVSRGCGQGRMESYCLMGIEFVLQDAKSYGNRRWSWLHNNVNVFHTLELYTEKWLRW